MPRLLTASVLLVAIGCDAKSGSDTDASGDTATISDDLDGDGYSDDIDCDADNPSVHPGATEICDELDNDCDGQVDEEVTTTFYIDTDGDGFGDAGETSEACQPPSGYVPTSSDCDDSSANAYPGATEVCDELDNDCDGQVDEDVSDTYYADLDGDAYGDPDNSIDACDLPADYVTDNSDCNDTSADAFPNNTETCDDLDNDCDDVVDEDVTSTFYVDADGDGYGDPSRTEQACELNTGYVEQASDCDDDNSSVHPDGVETCDEIDNDCDGDIDEDDASDVITWYVDADADGYGDALTSTTTCYQPSGYVDNDSDCDDGDNAQYPGADEYCNGEDDNCDDEIDESTAVDASPWYRDADNDAYGAASDSVQSCAQPEQYVSDDQDCDDDDSDQYPGANEYCNGEDDDCDGSTDEDGGVVDGETYYTDEDEDGLGGSTEGLVACEAPPGYADNAYDCHDGDSLTPIVVDSALGTSSGSGTLDDPMLTIADGIDAAGDCVIVYGGTYEENLDLGGLGVDLWGVEGAAATIIDGGSNSCSASSPTGCSSTITIAGGSNASPTLRGFTITGGSGTVSSQTTTETCGGSSSGDTGEEECTVTTYEYCGGGIYIDGDAPVLEDLVVEDNHLSAFEEYDESSQDEVWVYSYGGGICIQEGSVILDGVDIFDNYADQGGGLWAQSGATVSVMHANIKQNSASDGGGIYIGDATDLSMYNSVVACNAADIDGGGMFIADSSTNADLVNVVFFGDTATTGSTHAAAIYGDTATLSMMNSIVVTDIDAYALYGAGTSFLSYNDIYNSANSDHTVGGTWSQGAGARNEDPSFTDMECDGDTANDDVSLASGSAAIDAGTSDPAYADVDGTTNDLGAYGGPYGDW